MKLMSIFWRFVTDRIDVAQVWELGRAVGIFTGLLTLFCLLFLLLMGLR